jgi:SAM-dependent methyltransferase
MASEDWLPLQKHYEQCFTTAGATPRGVDWPNGRDLEARFATQLTLLDAVPNRSMRPPVLLDLGCGPGLLLDYLHARGLLDSIEYQGIDLSQTMIEAARSRWPGYIFDCRDILERPLPAGAVDVVLMNGILTERDSIPQERMVALAKQLIVAAFQVARVGIAFNAMSRHVDWERADLFHWGFDEVAAFLTQEVSRHLAIRSDYGLFEFTAFVWHAPQRPVPCVPESWWQR